MLAAFKRLSNLPYSYTNEIAIEYQIDIENFTARMS